MEVILLEKMRNLGKLGEQVKVKPGYARNYLIPQGKAVYATKDNLAKFEQRRAELEKMAGVKLEEAHKKKKTIQALQKITIPAKAGEEGKLFGSIGTRDIADALNKAGVAVEKREVRIAEGTLRMVGEYQVTIDLESDVSANLLVVVVPES